MSDSIRYLDEEPGERLNGKRKSGNLHKGRSIVPLRSTIPTKYQTVVISNSEQRGFCSQAKRFNYENHLTEGPGPGNYVGHSEAETKSTSFSKKGTGGFASKSRRIRRDLAENHPGVGSYKLPATLKSRHDFSTSNTSSFHRPVVSGTREPNSLPGPNIYKTATAAKWTNKTNNVSGDAAFKSKSKRELLVLKDSDRVAPTQYDVKDTLQRQSVKIPFSSFKSRTRRQMAPTPPKIPGPADYSPGEKADMNKKLGFPKQHYLCISAPAMPLPETPPLPGPGQYDIKGQIETEKHYMTHSAFVSSSSRWNSQARNPDFPGPAHYHPDGTVQSKQSFLYNAQQKWIC
ncbi:DgyrCDS13469 [Dimorphilus gyrociliatus]|uniref:DgyrCDS13469 n=1 Tax=Dimorphilus gyrociliatus TaxID=2664684 RepID=A0A7I8WAR3_9ANNE|nr:DgyrCDS13469 [Dimorphilus gyrociliatus]